METQEYLRQAQLCVLAGMLNRDGGPANNMLAEFHKNVFPETFTDALFGEICRAARDLYFRTGDCDPIVLLSEISTKPAQFGVADVQGATSIIFEATRANSVDSVALSRYLPMLHQAAMAKFLPIAQKDLENAIANGESYEVAYEKHVAPVVERYKYRAHEQYNVDKDVALLKEKVEGFKSMKIKQDQTVKTGFPTIDRALRGGMRPTQLIIVGARPATGKTTMALNIATNVIDNSDGHVIFVSLEQTADQLIEKIVSIKAQCLFPKTDEELRRVHFTGGVERIEKATNSFPFDRFHVIEKTENVDTLCASVGELCRKHKVSAVVIDYLQLIPSHGERSRYEAITRISNKLKVLAKDVAAPIVCLAQLSRGSDNESRAPRLADLRDSGSIEQDADVGILLYNDLAANDTEMALSNERKVNFDIQKNRIGRLANVKMAFTPSQSTFKEISLS